ncbi:hypothetical protein AB0L99_44255 [Streptomyces sp. NPDC051954]|uniref:hypothetical protein n=1 Tax=Streptomyces sp. NPDC051954 TaxID=3155524 RepID=UPI0034425FAF
MVLVDGAAHQLELIQKEADRRGITIHIVLDIVHVIEEPWASARCLHTAADPAAETWIGFKAARILAGDALGAVRDLREEAARRRLTDGQRTTIDKTCRYLENNAAFVHYDQALEAGWPIASGIVEGAARHLVADRLDITAADGASSAPKPDSPSVPSSATATSRSTGSSILSENANASIPTPTSTTTNSEPDPQAHSKGAAPIGGWHLTARSDAFCTLGQYAQLAGDQIESG